MNRQQILSRLAQRGWPVIYSTGALSTWDRHGEEWATAPWLGRFQICDGVSIETPGKALLRWPRIKAYDRRVVRWHAAALLRQARCSPSDAITYVFHPSLLPYVEGLNSRWVIYHAYDLFSIQPGWSAELARMEQDLVAKADLVVASSSAVAEALHGADRDHLLVLPNAADSQVFAAGPRLPCPADLAAVPRPRIGYIGRLNRKVDFQTIASVAQRRPQWHWALVGPVSQGGDGAPESDPQIAPAYRLCRELPNVHFLGSKPHTELPAYAGHMDINSICYRSDQGWWNAASPLKLYEYLATGRPIVSVSLPDTQAFSEIVTFVQDADGWTAALESALNGRSEAVADTRRRIGLENSWDNRVDELEQRIHAMTAQAAGRRSRRMR